MNPAWTGADRSARRLVAQWAVGLLALLAADPAQGAAREFLVRTWTRDEGLPDSTVTAVAQTPEGYLWVATLRGLARFDGVRFVGVDLRKEAGVGAASVVSLCTDSHGTLWIGVEDGHLVRFSQGRFTSYMPPSRQTADATVRRAVGAGDGSLWTWNYEGGLSRFASDVFHPIAARPDFVALTADGAGRVWVAARDELLMSEGGPLASIRGSSQEPRFQPQALAPARAGGCWVAGNGVIRRFEGGEWRETRVALPPAEMTAISGLLEDVEGNLWLSTYRNGVTVYSRAGARRRLNPDRGLPGDLVRCLFEDREGNVWAGLEGKGLARIRRALFASYGSDEGLSDEAALSFCEGTDGEVWIGSNGEGLFRVNDREVRHYRAREGLTNQFVWALLQDRAGRLWAGTWGDGLFRLKGERFVHTQPELGPTSVVLALHEDTRGALWLGQRLSDRCRIDAVELGLRRTYDLPSDRRRIDVSSIAETPDGSVWLGTAWNGLFRRQEGAFRQCDATLGLPPGPISALHVDDTGALWVAVEGAGLARWEHDRFTLVPCPPELVDEHFHQITDDGLGYLWCGSSSGVVRFNKESLHASTQDQTLPAGWRRFTKADGLPSLECSGRGGRTRDGRIWFLTTAGATVVDPRQALAGPSPPPSVLIEEVLLQGRSVRNDRTGTGVTAAGATVPDPSPGRPGLPLLRIPAGAGPVEIHYTAMNLSAPELTQFRIRLEGLEGVAEEITSARMALYRRLPAGQYEFRVAARQEGGAWDEAAARVTLLVSPRYWETRWFRLAALSLLVGAVSGAWRWVGVRQLRHRLVLSEEKRALEEERSRISRDLHDDLGTGLTEITLLGAVANLPSSSPDQVKSCLGEISDKSHELVRSLDEIVWAVNPKNDSLGNLVSYLCLFAQRLLERAAIQCRLDVPPDLPDRRLEARQRHALFLATKEALGNIAKHSAASEAWLRVTLTDSILTIALEDNGRGFDESVRKPDRNGLNNIDGRMRELGGRGSIRSVVGGGTRVELRLGLRDSPPPRSGKRF